MMAASGDHFEPAELLLRHGADRTPANQSNGTAAAGRAHGEDERAAARRRERTHGAFGIT
jgi:hypothetical protein